MNITILHPSQHGEFPCQYCQSFTVLECINCDAPVCKPCEGQHVRSHKKEARA